MAHSPEFAALCEDARSRITEITLDEWLDSAEQWTLVDVREDREWEAEHIPGAVHCGRGVLERDALSQWDKSTPLVLYCGGGFRSALAADNLQRMGFTRVRSLAGGIKRWRQERTIDFYFDVVCPYAYMGAVRIEALAERTRCRVRWKPILLGGVFKQIEAPLVPADSWSANRQRIIARDLQRCGERAGLDLRMPPGHPRRSVYAMRLLLSAPEERWRDLALALWQAYWEQGKDLDDEVFLEQFMREQGIVAAPAAKQELIDRTAAAVERGVFGVPVMSVGPHWYYGQDRLHLLEAALGGARAEPTSEHTGQQIEFCHDFSSPFSYLASTQIEALAERLGATVRYRPILLGGLFRTIGTPDVPLHAMSPPKQRWMLKDMNDQAKWLGQPLKWPKGFPLRTILALRVSIAEPRTISAIYAAAWAQDRDIATPEGLAAVLDEAGFDGAALIARTQDPAVKQVLRDNTDHAAAAGVCGVPTFVVGDHLVWGVDRLDHVEALLRGWTPKSG